MTRTDIERLIARVDSGLAFGPLKPYADALRWAAGEMDAMRPVVEAAEVYRDKRREVSKGMRRREELNGPAYELADAVDTYRTAKERS